MGGFEEGAASATGQEGSRTLVGTPSLSWSYTTPLLPSPLPLNRSTAGYVLSSLPSSTQGLQSGSRSGTCGED